MFFFYSIKAAQVTAPSFPTRSCIIQHGGKSRILCHYEITSTPAYEIFFYIQPFICPGEVIWLIIFNPFILPHRIFCAERSCLADSQTFEELESIGSGNLYSVAKTVLQFPASSLIHVTHRPVNRYSVPVHKDHSLHLRTEGQAHYLIWCNPAFIHYLSGGLAHGIPPLITILLNTAVFHGVKLISSCGAGFKVNGRINGEETCLYSCCAYIICQNIHLLPPGIISLSSVPSAKT